MSVSLGGRRVRRSFRSHDEALIFEAEARASLMKGEEPELSVAFCHKSNVPNTIGDMADHIWKLERSRQKSAESTLYRMERVVEYFGDRTLLSTITSFDLEKYALHLKSEHNAPATINRKMSIMTKILRYAYRHEVISHQPMVSKQKEPKGRVIFYTKDRETKLSDFMYDHDLRDLFLFSIDTGFRRSESLSIEWDDVDFVGNQIILSDPSKIKTSTPRTVPMTARVCEIMRIRSVTGNRPFEFTSYHVDDMISKYREVVQFKGPLIHTCRHTFCSRLVQRGVPLTTVMALAGHKDINTTLRYSHLAPSNLTDAIAKLERDPH